MAHHLQSRRVKPHFKYLMQQLPVLRKEMNLVGDYGDDTMAPNDGHGDDSDLKRHLAETIRTHWSIVLHFRSDKLEAHFLVEEYYRCRWRLFLNTFVWMAIGVAYRHVRPSITFLMDPIAISSGVAALLQLLLIAFDTFFIQPQEEEDVAAKEREISANTGHHQHGSAKDQRMEASLRSMDQQRAAPPSAKATTSKEESNDNNNDNEDLSLHDVYPLRVNQAYVQEGLASVWTVFQGIFLTYLMSEIQSDGTCLFLLRNEDGNEADWTFLDRELGHSCPFRVDEFAYWTAFIPIVVSQPRFHVVAFGYCVTFITAIVTHNMHNVSPGGQVILLVLFALYLVMLTVLKYFNEVQLRKRFVLRKLTTANRRSGATGR